LEAVAADLEDQIRQVKDETVFRKEALTGEAKVEAEKFVETLKDGEKLMKKQDAIIDAMEKLVKTELRVNRLIGVENLRGFCFVL
jgi:glutaredoxin 2